MKRAFFHGGKEEVGGVVLNKSSLEEKIGQSGGSFESSKWWQLLTGCRRGQFTAVAERGNLPSSFCTKQAAQGHMRQSLHASCTSWLPQSSFELGFLNVFSHPPSQYLVWVFYTQFPKSHHNVRASCLISPTNILFFRYFPFSSSLLPVTQCSFLFALLLQLLLSSLPGQSLPTIMDWIISLPQTNTYAKALTPLPCEYIWRQGL